MRLKPLPKSCVSVVSTSKHQPGIRCPSSSSGFCRNLHVGRRGCWRRVRPRVGLVSKKPCDVCAANRRSSGRARRECSGWLEAGRGTKAAGRGRWLYTIMRAVREVHKSRATPVQTGIRKREVQPSVIFGNVYFLRAADHRGETTESEGRDDAALLIDSTDAQDLIYMAEVLDFRLGVFQPLLQFYLCDLEIPNMIRRSVKQRYFT